MHNTRSINDPKTKVTVFQGKKHVELMFMFIIVEVDVIEIAMYVGHIILADASTLFFLSS